MRRTAPSLGLALLLTLFVLSPGPSHAISIGFDPVSQDVFFGNQAMVDIVISGLGDGDAPSLGAFDFVLGFDPSILALSSVVFGDPLLGDQLDLFAIGANPMGASESTPGEWNLFEVSLDLPMDLEDLQAGTFVLASLTFDTLALGTSGLDLFPGLIEPVFGDAYGEPLEYTIDPGSITVVEGTAPVPEPGTILLLGSGLLGLAGLRKRFG